jgi:serine/threonine-protein kinase
VSQSSTVSGPQLPPHYQVRQRLGEGGFGEVFEAWDNKLARSVAVKSLKNLGDTVETSRLVTEARLAASLQHAAFVKIYALEGEQASQSIVMELVRGKTLREIMPVSEQQALAIVRQIAEAMAEAHESGLIHGDLKPSNVMVEPAGAARILDFGLASHADSQVTMTLAQADPQGTIAYMAPERMLGHSLSAQSDIYALGVILYELLSGARPFPELSGFALAAAHVQSSAERWPYPAGLKPELASLVQAMCATDLSQRLKSMRQVCQRLSAVDGIPLGALHYPVAVPLWSALLRWSSRHRRAALISGAVVLALGGVWLAAPHMPSVSAMQAWLKPYSEAVEMREGLQALRMWDLPGELASGEQHFAAVLERNPNNAAAVAGMSLVYMRRYTAEHRNEIWRQKAQAAAQQALRLNDQLALSRIAQGTVLVREGKGELALAEFDRALSLDPQNIFALDGQINALRKLGRQDDALKIALASSQRYPHERLFADQAGSIYYKQQRYEEAEQAFRQSIKIQPDAVFAYANLSAALAVQGRDDDALSILQQGLQVRPSSALYGNLGNTLFLRHDYVGAADAFQAAVDPRKGDPSDYLAWANLADTLLWIPGREAQASAAYGRAGELLAVLLNETPQDVTMLSRMGLYHARTGKNQDAEKMLARVLALAPASAEVQFRAGLAYELISNRPAALAAIARAAQLGYPVKFIEAAPELIALRRDAGYSSK